MTQDNTGHTKRTFKSIESKTFSHYLSVEMRIVFLFLFFVPISLFGQFELQFSTDVPFTMNGNTLSRALEGGLNSAQFQTMDLDLDGDEDLVIYNRIGSNFQTYLNENSQYVWAPEYAFQFPEDVIGWVVLVDYDCDGDKDLFTSTSLGIKAYENTSSNQLSWQEAAPFLSFDAGTNMQVSRADIPGFADVNGDGAIDILTYRFGTSTTIDYFENTGSCGDLTFTRADRNWGGIQECDCNDFRFRQPCDQLASRPNVTFSANATQHAGGKVILPFDSDNDGDIDIITSDEFCETLYFMENEGDRDEAVMNGFSSFPENNPAAFPFFPNAFLEDINFDGTKELIISTNADQNIGNQIELSRNIQVYENQGSNDIPLFNQASVPFLQNEMIDLGEDLYPAFADLDEDGDEDLFIGNKGLLGTNGLAGSIYYFENVGTEFNPQYEMVDDDFMNIRETNQTHIKPFFIDTDNDGDLDLIYQATFDDTITRMYYQMNNGSFNFSQAITLDIDMSVNDNPFWYDVNEDGAPDVLFGTQFGGLSVFYNRASMIFTIENENFAGIENDFNRQSLSVYIADMDGNGTDDLVTLDNSGEIRIFQGPINNRFIADEPITDLININDEQYPGDFGRENIIAIADIYGNRKPPVFVGTTRGGLHFLRNTSEIANGGEGEILMTVAPNPSSSTVRVSTNTTGLISLYNLMGQRLLADIGVSPSQPQTLNVSDIPAGLYLIRFMNNSGRGTTKRLIVVK